jgi:hypothetical protein
VALSIINCCRWYLVEEFRLLPQGAGQVTSLGILGHS